MSHKKFPNNGHQSMTAQQVAFMHQVIESEDKHRAKFSKSPPRRKRNPILGEPTPRSTSREKDIAELKNAQLEHTRKSMAMTPTIAGRRRAAERAAAAKAIATMKTSPQVPLSAVRAESKRKDAGSEKKVASGRRSKHSSRASARESARASARFSARDSSRESLRGSARSGASARDKSLLGSGKSAAAFDSRSENKNSPKMKEMKARKAWLERQLKEVEDQLSTLPPDLE